MFVFRRYEAVGNVIGRRGAVSIGTTLDSSDLAALSPSLLDDLRLILLGTCLRAEVAELVRGIGAGGCCGGCGVS